MRAPVLALLLAAQAYPAEPIRLHPDNPRYFLFRGKPTVLVTSGEHYGAVINLDFDCRRYLRTLAADGLNHTRTWAGAYREIPGSFQIPHNTLAPAAGRFICPWPRSATPGARDGAAKFDLSRWNPAYFERLKDFLREAAARGVVVELNLFCPYYEDAMWNVSPLNPANNINGIGRVERTEALTLKHPRLVAVQEAMVRKIVAELREFDNLYYEICNEPYFGGVTPDWQAHIAQVIAQTEDSFPHRHLISQNIANGSRKVDNPNPLVSIFNFHYSRPPDSVALNYGLNKAIGNNETGFDGTADAAYRIQGWDFLMAGGALYSNLDYSFIAGKEDGSFVVPASAPGGGGPALRRQLKALKDFFDGLDFLKMAPANSILRLPDGAGGRVLAQPRKVYAIYVHHARIDERAKPRYQVPADVRQIDLTLDLPAGPYSARWLNAASGAVLKREQFTHAGGGKRLTSPPYTQDIALLVRRK